MLKIIYTTGLTGFIGQHFLKKLFNEYDLVINFGREKNITIYKPFSEPVNQDFSLELLEKYSADTLFHLATHYNPNPTNISEEKHLKESNYSFPKSLL